MNSKKNKKEITVNALNQQLDSINQSANISTKKVADIFGRIQYIKNIRKEEIKGLFFKAIKISNKNSWEFLLEIYSRFYNRTKVKTQNEIIQLIELEIEKRLDPFVSQNDISLIVSSIAINGKSDLLEEKFNNLKVFCKEKDYLFHESITYFYIILLIVARRAYMSNYAIFAKIEREIFIRFAEDDNNDPLFIKSIKDSLIDGKFAKKFKEITYLYDGVDEELVKLKSDNNEKKEIIITKLDEIKVLKENNFRLNDEILQKTQEIKENKRKISELELLVSKTDDRNEYNENLYRQQFLSLKRNLIEKLKKELHLEIEGLEDIADTLNNVQREKMQRRIDRIYKIIQKVGE